MTAGPYDQLYEDAGHKWNVDPLLIRAHAIQETGEDPRKTGAAGEWGMMQFMPGTAASVGLTREAAYQPATAIDAAGKFIRGNLDAKTDAQGNTDIGGATRRYNGSGPATYAYEKSIAGIYQKLKAEQAASGARDAAAPKAASPFEATMATPATQSASPFEATMMAPATPPAPQAGQPAAPATPGPSAFDSTMTAPATPAAAATAQVASDSGPGSWIPAGLARGAHQGLDVPAEALARGVDWMAGKLGYQTSQGPQTAAADQTFNSAYDQNPANEGLGPAAARMTGLLATVLPTALPVGRLMQGGARLLGAALPTAAPVINALAPVASGAAQGAATALQTGEPLGENAAIGGVLGGAGGLIGKGINKLTTTARPDVVAAVNNYGIPLRAGQTSENKFVRYLDSQIGSLPFSGQAASDAAQRTAVVKAAGRTFGENTEEITPKLMSNAKDRIGGVINAIEGKNNVALDNALMDNFANIEHNANSSLTSQEYGVVKKQFENVLKNITPGNEITGTTYGHLIHKGSALDAATNSANPNIAHFAGQIKSALQDALQRSLSPADAETYALARLQYKNMMTIAPPAGKGIPGEISPLLLQGAANRSFKGNAFRGAGDLGELGDIAQKYLRPPPDSGTATRNQINLSFYGDMRQAGRNLLGATVGRGVESIVGANPLTGPRIANGIPGAIPSGLLLRNRLLAEPEQPR